MMQLPDHVRKMLKRDNTDTNPESTADADVDIDDRIAELERIVAAQQAALRDLAELNRRPPPRSGLRRSRCAHCDDGWIIEDQEKTRIICDTCGYIRYL